MSNFFCFLIIFLPVVFGTKYDCAVNETVTVDLNEIVFFESLNYPHSVENVCQLNFSMKESKNTQKLLIVFFNAVDVSIRKEFSLFIVSNENFSFSAFLKDNYYEYRPSIQGYVTHEDIDAGCPLEALSNPLIIHDETEIIVIRSTYFENQQRIRPCKWEFKTTQNYGFKVVIEILNISSSTQLTVSNSTQAFLDERIAKLYYPFYNRDNYLQISLSLDNLTTTFIPAIEFQAYISVVKNKIHTSYIDCTVINSTDTIIWSNDLDVGYSNNAHCSTSFVILQNHGLLVAFDSYFVEKGADFLQYSINGGNKIIIEDKNRFVIEAKKDEPNKYVWFEFVSDGSVQRTGFYVSFNIYACKCAATVIPCGVMNWNIMHSPQSQNYCSNLKCYFTFEPCPGYKIQILVNSDEKDYFSEDMFKISSNNETVLEINRENFERVEFIIYLNPENLNTLETITSSSSKYRSFQINYLMDYDHTVGSQISLSSIQSFSFIDNRENYIIEVSQNSAEKSLGFIFYTNRELNRDISIYNNKSLTIMYSDKNCSGSQNSYKCILPYQNFVVTFPPDTYYTFLAVRLSKPSIGCVLEENIFVAKKSDETLSIVGISNSEGKCVLQLLIEDDINFHISYLWTTSALENVKIYVGMDTKHLLFEFNTKTMKNWNQINLFSRIYSIHIPSNSTFWMTLTRDIGLPIINIFEHPFRSVIATPNFNIFSSSIFAYLFDDDFLSFNIGNISVKFTIVHFRMLDENQLHIFVKNNDLTVFNPGTSVIFKNEVVKIFYLENTMVLENFDDNQGAIIYVESLFDKTVN